MALRLTGNRKYPSLPSVGSSVDSHTAFLTVVKEALEISQRRTNDLLNSHIRVQDLIDLGLIDFEGNTNAIVGADLSQIASIGDLSGSAAGDFLRYDGTQWVNDQLALTDITQTMVTQHQAALSIAWSQLTGVPDLGEDNTASNLGAGTGLFAQKSGVDLQFKSLVQGSNVTITSNATTVTIAASSSGSLAIDDLSDVDTIYPVAGDVLTWDGYQWTNQASPDVVVDAITSSSTWTKPTGAVIVEVVAYGAGGGGGGGAGGAAGSARRGGAGGAGGARVVRTFRASDLPSSVAVSIGAGGAGGAGGSSGAGTAGSAGGSSTFGSLLTAFGGGGGGPGSSAAAAGGGSGGGSGSVGTTGALSDTGIAGGAPNVTTAAGVASSSAGIAGGGAGTRDSTVAGAHGLPAEYGGGSGAGSGQGGLMVGGTSLYGGGGGGCGGSVNTSNVAADGGAGGATGVWTISGGGGAAAGGTAGGTGSTGSAGDLNKGGAGGGGGGCNGAGTAGVGGAGGVCGGGAGGGGGGTSVGGAGGTGGAGCVFVTTYF